jgi:hypothetical protein
LGGFCNNPPVFVPHNLRKVISFFQEVQISLCVY